MCQDSKSKKVKYFPASLLTIANSFSIMIKQIALSCLQTTEYPSCVTVMAYPLGQIERGDEMENTSFMRVEEVAQELGISKSYAYKIVQKLNEELKSKGFLTISGRVNKQYFMERTCYGAVQKER